MAETINQVLARVGLCILTGTTPETLAFCIGVIIRRIWVYATETQPNLSCLALITTESLSPFNNTPDDYLWLLNIYLRGKEILFEIGICPRAKIASLEHLESDPEHFLSPVKFAKWEEKQSGERKRTVGIALRDFCKRNSAKPDKLYAKANGVHLAYILGNDSGNHISVMTNTEKRMYYFNEDSYRYRSCSLKYYSDYCSMTRDQFVATTSILQTISSALATKENGHIRTALAWMENPTASSSLSSYSRFDERSPASGFRASGSSSGYGRSSSGYGRLSSGYGRSSSGYGAGSSSDSSGKPGINSASWRS